MDPARPMIQPPTKYLLRMALFLVAVVILVVLQLETIILAAETNLALNGLILAVLLVGMVLTVRMVLSLRPEVAWIAWQQRAAGPDDNHPDTPPPPVQLLGPLAALLREVEGGGRPRLTAQTLRTLLDGIATRLDEGREIARYLTGLLIFLGLLGTFWGLIQTVDAIGGVVQSLDLGVGDLSALWTELKDQLQQPLAGMGTAFSSSLFGLAGSLVLGFLDLQAGQAQSRFFLDVEDWLSSHARLGDPMVLDDPLGAGVGETAAGASRQMSTPVPTPGPGPLPSGAELAMATRQTHDNIEALTRALAASEAQRRQTLDALHGLATQVQALSQQIKSEQALLMRLSEERAVLGPAISRLNDLLAAGDLHGDQPATRHLASIDARLHQVVQGLEDNRERTVRELSSEIRVVSRTMRAIVDGGEPPPGTEPPGAPPGPASGPAPGPSPGPRPPAV